MRGKKGQTKALEVRGIWRDTFLGASLQFGEGKDSIKEDWVFSLLIGVKDSLGENSCGTYVGVGLSAASMVA
jgi:hypothetical protein